MNFLRRLFGTAATENNQEAQPVFVNEHLFRTDEDPVLKIDEHKAESQPALEEILKRDFESIGFHDGYHMHAPEQLTNRLNSIKAEFRMIYQKEIQYLASEMFNCKKYLTDALKEHLPHRYQAIQNQFDELSLQKVALEAELELAKKGEGYCEKAVADYRMGFEKGFSLFTDEEIFNNRYLLP